MGKVAIEPLITSLDVTRSDFNEVFLNSLHNKPGPKFMKMPSRPETKFLHVLNKGNVEILRAYFAICDISAIPREASRPPNILLS